MKSKLGDKIRFFKIAYQLFVIIFRRKSQNNRLLMPASGQVGGNEYDFELVGFANCSMILTNILWNLFLFDKL